MSSYPTPPPPPPPPPFAPDALQLPGVSSGASSPTAIMQPPSPAPGSSASYTPPIYHNNSAAATTAHAPSPFAIALPGGGLHSTSISSSHTGGSAFNQIGTSAQSPPLVLPLGPPPPGLMGPAKRAGGIAAAKGGVLGRARQTKGTSADPAGPGDDDLLPPATPPGAMESTRNDDEDADEAEDDMNDGDELQSMEARTRARQENMPYLIDAMTPEQSDRHDAFRRSAISRGSVKRLMNQVLAQSVPDSVALVAGGATKIFVGEIVEKARMVQAKQAGAEVGAKDLGPLRPEHIHEAHRLYTLERDRPGRFPPTGGLPGVGKRRRLF